MDELGAADRSAVSEQSLADAFTELGLGDGDAVLVHSSLKAIGPVEGGAAAVIAALERTIGVAGTLIMPTFNFGFCSGETFDVRSTPSQMGVLTELVRTDPRARRVRHPIYSFAVLGALAEEAARLRNFSSYGADSLFAKLVEWDAKIMVIGLSYNNSMTFFHYVEEMEGCKYRYMKSFTAPYVDELGNGSERTYTMFVRDLERGVVTAVDPMGELLEREGAVVCGEVGESAARLMRARDVYAITARNLTDQPGLLFRIDISDSL